MENNSLEEKKRTGKKEKEVKCLVIKFKE